MNISYTVVVGGSKLARERFPAKTYKTKRSATRRVKTIKDSDCSGVATIWTLRNEDKA